MATDCYKAASLRLRGLGVGKGVGFTKRLNGYIIITLRFLDQRGSGSSFPFCLVRMHGAPEESTTSLKELKNLKETKPTWGMQ